MAQQVRVRGLTEQEGQKLQHIVRRGSTGSVRFRRAMMLLASAGGSTVPVIARPVQADGDTVRDVIHKFNEIGLACLDPRWAGGRPRLLNRDDEDFVVQTATTRPTVLGKPFTRWSIRKLADHLRRNITRPVRIGREALRCLLARRGVSFQRTKTWKESPDPDFDTKLNRIEYAINQRPNHTFMPMLLPLNGLAPARHAPAVYIDCPAVIQPGLPQRHVSSGGPHGRRQAGTQARARPVPPYSFPATRVRRGIRNLQVHLLCPAHAPKPSRPGPGRPLGSKNKQSATGHRADKTTKGPGV
ncbi:helix-turn-helix domain-containing protein [Streptomyces sp. NBC_01343]|nr:helix-turn-helix domain-containing protein [Streptomyces sp. NBC_01343]